MKQDYHKRFHERLDGETIPPDATDAEEEARLTAYRAELGRLENRRVRAPADLAARVMEAITPAPRPTFLEWLWTLVPTRRQWAIPALAGAVLMLALLPVLRQRSALSGPPRMLVHFQIHAPGAERVELVGDFNNWTAGTIQLQGPDASGHWTTDVELPEGRYEYQFLVNGTTWVTDPGAEIRRPDGFGRENAVRVVYEERS
ncbi:MAG TPA: isoamylase early set domain-containing protein [Kiritimatiellia bacterium]|nr:isoamylase early set domain-containing protein [Kiritimatiellia bacterium]HRZ13316.1 isoamylase early set domain-containing protein [Kiritimatiellia bacterium]HSA18765.1 isoamylase early set domain-containing protein [Kiritimatiellia bacterium]